MMMEIVPAESMPSGRQMFFGIHIIEIRMEARVLI